MTNEIVLDGESLDPKHLWVFSSQALKSDARFKITIAPTARAKIQKASDYVAKVTRENKPVYGINTGFGKFAEVAIAPEQLEQLQRNLIVSHSCGMGELLSRDLVMAMWIIRLNTVCRGNSGVRNSTLDYVIKTLEAGMLAHIPSRGSVGASGDLSPSAHATLALLGEGKCSLPRGGQIKDVSALEALQSLGLSPLVLGPKEGLSLINGTQLTTALATKAWFEGTHLLKTANLSASMMIEGLRASPGIVHPLVIDSRNQRGATICAEQMRHWLDGNSEIARSHAECGRVQDPYSLRCAPQVHGCLAEDLLQAENIIRSEINASTDNPLLFPDDSLSLPGGNFHALYTARVNDMLASSLATLASISERRIALAMTPESSRLPPFLVKDGGINSGMMIIQYTAAALVSECKSLSFPASVDSISTSGDREDHVSMGPGAGFKANQIVDHVRRVLAIELLIGAQAIDLLAPLKTTVALQKIHKTLRTRVAFLEHDRVISNDALAIEELVRSRGLIQD